MSGFLMRFADNRDPRSLASRMRAKRQRWLVDLVAKFPQGVEILDVGGTAEFWRALGKPLDGARITLLNQDPVAAANGFTTVVGDARDLSQYRDRQFDVVFSNSVIEHVGGREDRARMAAEVRRVGKSYMVQTPHLYFPVEPHFHVPLFQFMPMRMRAEMLRRWNLGWYERAQDLDEATRVVKSVDLIGRAELRSLFPDAHILTERFLGLPKSLIAIRDAP
jgi:hypothetical protein